MPELSYIEVETAAKIDASIIWLHGLGADGHDFEPIIPQLRLPDTAAIRFIFPHPPSIPVTINDGMVMPAWYDIVDMSMDQHIDQDQIMQAAEWIKELIKQETDRGIESQRIIIAGFSQGGAVAYEVALTYPEPLAGLMALSTYLHAHEHLSEEVSFASIDVPIFMAHGRADPMIPIARAVTSREAMAALNYQIQWHEYAMGHQVCPEEIADIAAWLNSIYP